MSEPVITVAMSAYNAGPFVSESIESILAQGFGDFEFLIVNDGSTDGTGAIIDDYAGQDSRIVAIHQENGGLIAALNRTIDLARGRWTARMDADDVALPDRFERQLAFLDSHPECGILGGNSKIIDSSGAELDRPSIDRPLRHEDILANFRDGPNLHHPTIMVATELLRKVNGYRLPFRVAQDYDLYLRLIPHTRFANLDDALLLYRVHDEQASTKRLMRQTLSAVVAWLAHEARMAGRPDPVQGLTELPAPGTLDALFEVKGADAWARAKIMERIIYSPDILAQEGFGVLLDHVRDVGSQPHLWRIVPRLARAGYVGRSARLGATLAAA